jgi:hypothetical protein
MIDRGNPFVDEARRSARTNLNDEQFHMSREGLRSDMLHYAERLGEPLAETPTAEQAALMADAHDHFLRLMEVLKEDGLLPSEDDDEEYEEDDKA